MLDYKGYKIRKSNGLGKAGRFAKTYSLQVIKDLKGTGYLIKKTISRIPKDDYLKQIQAIEKAKKFIDSIT